MNLKIIKNLLFIYLGYFLSSPSLCSENNSPKMSWISIGPGSIVSVNAMAKDSSNSNIFYVAAGRRPCHIFKSIDKGNTWNQISTINDPYYQSDYTFIWCLTVDPNDSSIVFAGGYEKIYKSEDGGETWSNILVHGARIMDIVVTPGNSDLIHACGQHCYAPTTLLYLKSEDGGLHWTSRWDIIQGLSSGHSIALGPSNPDIVYIGGSGQVLGNESLMLKSIDSGNTWNDISAGIRGYVYDITIDPLTSDYLLAGTSYGIYTLLHTDTNWVAWNRGYAQIYDVEVDPNNSNSFMGVSSDSLYLSLDRGVSWSTYFINSDGGECSGIYVDKDTSNIICLANNNGFFKSKNCGIDWEFTDFSSLSINITALKYSPSSPNVVYTAVKGDVIYKTTNSLNKPNMFSDVEWQILPAFEGCSYVPDILVDPYDANIVYAIAPRNIYFPPPLIYRSTIDGLGWTTLDNPGRFYGYTLSWGSLYIGGIGDIDTTGTYGMTLVKTNDNGQTWKRHVLDTQGGFVNSIVTSPTDSNLIYVGGYIIDFFQNYVPRLFKTTDSGIYWTEIGLSFGRKLTVFRIDPFNHDKIYVGTEKDPVLPFGGVYVSTDEGATWQPPNQSYDIRCMAMDTTTSGRLFIGTSTGVYMSTDGATSWEGMNDGLLNTDVSCIDFDPVNSVLYAGTNGSGVFRYSFETGIEDHNKDTDLPNELTLYQNYPNPFNMSTTLQYDLPQSGPVKILIYDIHGRLVRVLKDGHENAGVKRVIWDGKDRTGTEISSGVYVVRLVSGSRVQMQKIVLQK